MKLNVTRALEPSNYDKNPIELPTDDNYFCRVVYDIVLEKK